MYSGKKLKHTETVLFWACIAAVTVAFGGAGALPSRFQFVAAALAVAGRPPAVVSVGLRRYVTRQTSAADNTADSTVRRTRGLLAACRSTDAVNIVRYRDITI